MRSGQTPKHLAGVDARVVVLLLCVVFSQISSIRAGDWLLDDISRKLAKVKNVPVPLPKTTPYDADVEARKVYLSAFKQGYHFGLTGYEQTWCPIRWKYWKPELDGHYNGQAQARKDHPFIPSMSRTDAAIALSRLELPGKLGNDPPSPQANQFISDARMQFDKLKREEEKFVRQQELLDRDVKVERQIVQGEQMNLPQDYTSVFARNQELNKEARNVQSCANSLSDHLDAPEASALTPEARAVMEKAVTIAESMEPTD